METMTVVVGGMEVGTTTEFRFQPFPLEQSANWSGQSTLPVDLSTTFAFAARLGEELAAAVAGAESFEVFSSDGVRRLGADGPRPMGERASASVDDPLCWVEVDAVTLYSPAAPRS